MKQIHDFLLIMDKISEEKFNIKIPKYEVLFNLKSERILGMFFVKRKEIGIRFHLELYEKVGFEKYKEVVIHEYAHLINYVLNKGLVMPHGKEWKQIMISLGIVKPMATTSTFNKELLIKAKCKCSKHLLTKSNVLKIKNGIKLRCNNCGKKIKLID